MSIGVPIKVLHEAVGLIVTCETITGDTYRGKLIQAEDNMNCQMTDVIVTHSDGKVTQVEDVYIRGSKITFLILPDMLINAPMFKKQTAGQGKSAIFCAQAARARGRGRGVNRAVGGRGTGKTGPPQPRGAPGGSGRGCRR